MRNLSIVLATALFALTSALSNAQSPVPFINLPLVPDATAPGGPQFILTVNGTGFVSNSVVDWNGRALVTRFISHSKLKARVPAQAIAAPGTAQVTVVSSSPGGGTSSAIAFEITTPISSPTFNEVDAGQSGADSVAAADFNGDGNLDIAGVNLGTPVSVYLGDGQGGFTYRGDYSTGPNNDDSLTVGDFNGDGILDLALRGGAVLLGNGDGSFQPPLTFPVKCDDAVAVGDFNADGKLDLACTDSQHGVYILLGNGDGTFQQPTSYPLGSGSYAIAVGDFNHDGRLDLAIAVQSQNEVAIMLGRGNGTFDKPTYYHTGGVPGGVYAADLDGDGVLDLVVLNSSLPEALVFLGNGDGTFGSPTAYPFPTGGNVYRGGVADLNGDGKLDVLATTT